MLIVLHISNIYCSFVESKSIIQELLELEVSTEWKQNFENLFFYCFYDFIHKKFINFWVMRNFFTHISSNNRYCWIYLKVFNLLDFLLVLTSLLCCWGDAGWGSLMWVFTSYRKREIIQCSLIFPQFFDEPLKPKKLFFIHMPHTEINTFTLFQFMIHYDWVINVFYC